MSTRGASLSSEIQQGVEQPLLGAGACETDSQISPVTSQLYAASSLWANHNGPEETNGNEASLLLANQERGVANSYSSGGKTFNLIGLLPIIMIISGIHSQPELLGNNNKKNSIYFAKILPNSKQVDTTFQTVRCQIMLLFGVYVLTFTVNCHQGADRWNSCFPF